MRACDIAIPLSGAHNKTLLCNCEERSGKAILVGGAAITKCKEVAMVVRVAK